MSRASRIFIGLFPKKDIIITNDVTIILTTVVTTSATGNTGLLTSLNNKRISAMHFQKPYQPIAFGV